MTRAQLVALAEIMAAAVEISNERMRGGASLATYEFECIRDAITLILSRKEQ